MLPLRRRSVSSPNKRFSNTTLRYTQIVESIRHQTTQTSQLLPGKQTNQSRPQINYTTAANCQSNRRKTEGPQACRHALSLLVRDQHPKRALFGLDLTPPPIICRP